MFMTSGPHGGGLDRVTYLDFKMPHDRSTQLANIVPDQRKSTIGTSGAKPKSRWREAAASQLVKRSGAHLDHRSCCARLGIVSSH
ncbi:hypothetical protein AVEN_255627-1 [Araneus ventricosus]|uniref:Uncharacterized protein n=1 Tax=Araneus ventricosus TaxID=182803 RepID=A0A4Y2W469_ARAVE|nr:hypothetical protein AVEN_255627-1 [Araneus ventricosus]